ncbi:ABC transporter substrate-binding protein [Haloprofundus marisrubri]|uniref:ABC transporter substrate-binding protein n=1 Tax=Haloprofundus marisrubri TaxID=1514971 RepID=A0A0W1R7G5_9EURY|nr:ABC transporter substrate-binding protein [Haloprofundus marisrubri]KTG09153.1 ABC transporter substrate-binding protein [Haloprofundus marisrubri]
MNERTTDRVTRRRLLRGTAAAGLAGLAGCAGGGGDDAGSGNDTATNGSSTETQGEVGPAETLSVAQVKTPLGFDPIQANNVPSLQIVERLFDSLYTYAEGTELVPEIAAADPEITRDGTRYVVPLREEARFQNGDPVTAEDVKYSFEAPGREETPNGSEFDMIDSISVVDESTVQFDLAYSFGPFRHTLAWEPVPKSVRESDRDAFHTESPVGTGPFQLVDWQEGQYVTLERWDDYWGDEQANVARIEFEPVEESTTRVTTLRQGNNDIIEEIPPKLYSTVEQIPNASVTETPGLGYYYLAFNCNEGPTADKRVREAVDYCVDMDQAVSNFVEPAGERQYTPLPQSLIDDWGFPQEQWAEIPHEKNVDEARRLFDEAGVDADYSWRIIVPPDDKREQIGVSVANGLQEAGFDAEVQRLDWGAFLDAYSTGNESDYNMYTLGWLDEVDPDGYLYYMFHESEEGSTNGCYYRNDEVMTKLDEARQTADREQRKSLYTDVVTTLMEDRPHLAAYNLKNSFGVRDRVAGFEPHTMPSQNPRFVTDSGRVSLEK